MRGPWRIECGGRSEQRRCYQQRDRDERNPLRSSAERQAWGDIARIDLVVDHTGNHVGEFLQMLLERRGHSVEPVRHAHEVFETACGRDIFDPERQDHQSVMHRAFDLAADLRRFVGVGREDQHEHSAPRDTLYDRLAPFATWANVARRDPAAIAARLEPRARGVTDCLILRGIADEDLRIHGRFPVVQAQATMASMSA